jgi:hypothetical protein
MKVPNPVMAFDQSTTCTGITFGDNKGNIYGFARLVKEDRNENGSLFITNFREWLGEFVDMDLNYLIYEHTFSKQYFRTDVILSQLRGVFTDLKTVKKWNFPVQSVMQQEWKANLMKQKIGDRTLSKENAHYVILNYLYPNLPAYEEFDDVYDSIGIYNYYKDVYMNMDLKKPVKVTTKLKLKEVVYKQEIFCSESPDRFSKIAKYRETRYFEFNPRMTLQEQLERLVSNSNELWVCKLPLDNNPYIDTILEQAGLPLEGQSIWLMGYRVKSKKFNKLIL